MSVRRFLLLQLAVWTTYGIVHYLAVLPAVTPDERPAMALANLVRAVTGLVETTAIWPLIQRGLDGGRWRAWLALGLVPLVTGFAWTFFDRAVLVTVASIRGVAIPWDRFPRGVDLDYFVFMFAWTAAAIGMRLWRRERAAREALLEQRLATHEAQVRALAARLNPHFLFNSLNAIRAFIAEDPGRAREMVGRLAGFLRHALTIDPAVPSTLGEEVETARAYLRIEEARFEPDLAVDVAIDDAAARVLVPPLLLQPLVENAVLHGDPAPDGVRRVGLEARMEGGRLRLEVANTGALAGRPEGVGLALTRTRLAQMYGDGQRVDLSTRNGRVVATVEIDAPRIGGPPTASAG